jgi:hypothetical protein
MRVGVFFLNEGCARSGKISRNGRNGIAVFAMLPSQPRKFKENLNFDYQIYINTPWEGISKSADNRFRKFALSV